jgi:hypothetical protein
MITLAVVIAPDSTDTEDASPIPITAAHAGRVAESASEARIRLRLRVWEARRRFAGRAVIATSFPIAFLLLMGSAVPHLAVHIALWLWLGAVSAAIGCTEPMWRLRCRLERRPVGRAVWPVRSVR